MQETQLYQPVKQLLLDLGYEVKAEIGACDVMAVRGGEQPVIVELKTGFSLTLFHQAVERLASSDQVYMAVPRGKGRRWYKSFLANKKLARRLGLGLILVDLDSQAAQIACDPAPYASRKSAVKAARLADEFNRRKGDPNQGGSTRTSIVTAYRQEAERLRDVLADQGPTKASVLRDLTGIERARSILYDNHYGWFQRVGQGVYGLA